jgi:proteasome beta subunit
MSGGAIDRPAHRDPPVRVASGTTTIGIACRDGVVLATERRFTMGSFIASGSGVKLFRIDARLGATFAGGVGDAQAVIRMFQSEVALYRMRAGVPLRVESAVTALANLLNASRYAPYYAWLIVGGVDASGPHVFTVDADGAVAEDPYVSVGSGSPFVYGVLEDARPRNPTLAEGTDLALRGLSAAMRRDSASGDGYDVAQITVEGFRRVPSDDVRRRVGQLGLAPASPSARPRAAAGSEAI